MLPPRYVNPVAAKGGYNREGKKEGAERDTAGLHLTGDGCARFSQVATPDMWGAGREPGACLPRAWLTGTTVQACVCASIYAQIHV